MAEPVRFESANMCWKGDPEVGSDLHVFQCPTTGESVSCWALDEEELKEIVRTGRIWIGVLGPHPYIRVMGNYPLVHPEEVA